MSNYDAKTIERESYCMDSMQKRLTDEANRLDTYAAAKMGDTSKYPSVLQGKRSSTQPGPKAK